MKFEVDSLSAYNPRILDYDTEVRPLSFLGGDFTTGEITAIAAGFLGEDQVYVWQLTAQDMRTDASVLRATRNMLLGFVELYNQADLVTGHYISRFDMGKVNAALFESGLPGLQSKAITDTKCDLKKFQGVSKSQESLGLMLKHFDSKNQYKHLASKEHMSQDDWRRANRLTEEGTAETKRRVQGDILQHQQLYKALCAADMLHSPRIWRP